MWVFRFYNLHAKWSQFRIWGIPVKTRIFTRCFSFLLSFLSFILKRVFWLQQRKRQYWLSNRKKCFFTQSPFGKSCHFLPMTSSGAFIISTLSLFLINRVDKTKIFINKIWVTLALRCLFFVHLAPCGNKSPVDTKTKLFARFWTSNQLKWKIDLLLWV